jgi:hypothetical protein
MAAPRTIAGAWQARSAVRTGGRPYDVDVSIEALPVRTGEFLGQKTIADLRDFMRVVIFEQNQLSTAAQACTAWATSAPDKWDAWKKRFDAYAQDLANTIGQCQALVDTWAEWTWPYAPIGTSPSPDCMECAPPGVDVYKALLALRKRAAQLDAELRADSQCTPPNYAGMPQPTAADPDLKVYNATGQVTTAIDKGIKDARDLVTSRAPYLVVGVAAGVLALLWLQNGRGRG